jgi:hypothetical protein
VRAKFDHVTSAVRTNERTSPRDRVTRQRKPENQIDAREFDAASNQRSNRVPLAVDLDFNDRAAHARCHVSAKADTSANKSRTVCRSAQTCSEQG